MHTYARGCIEKPLGAKERANNQLNSHMAWIQGFEPGSHWWERSDLTTAREEKIT